MMDCKASIIEMPRMPRGREEWSERYIEWQEATQHLRDAITKMYLANHPTGFCALKDGTFIRDEYKFTDGQQALIDGLKFQLELSKFDFGLIAERPTHLPPQPQPPGADESPASSSRTEHPKADSQP